MANQAQNELVFYPATEQYENSFIERIGLRLKEYFFRKHQKLTNAWIVAVYDMSDTPVNEYQTSLKNCNCLAGRRNIDCKHKMMLKMILDTKQKTQKRYN